MAPFPGAVQGPRRAAWLGPCAWGPAGSWGLPEDSSQNTFCQLSRAARHCRDPGVCGELKHGSTPQLCSSQGLQWRQAVLDLACGCPATHASLELIQDNSLPTPSPWQPRPMNYIMQCVNKCPTMHQNSLSLTFAPGKADLISPRHNLTSSEQRWLWSTHVPG